MDKFRSPRDYGNMEMKDVIESIIRDAKLAGSLAYPLRTEGYHKSSNLVLSDRYTF